MSRFYLIVLQVIPFAAMAQNSLTGIINDLKDKSPIPGATVFIPELRRGCVSDANGLFSMEDLPAGNFLIEAKLLGFKPQIEKIKIIGKVTLNISMSSTVAEMSEVIVTGASSTTQRLVNPVASQTMNLASLQEKSSTNLIDGISKIPGVSQITTGGGISKPVIRGLSYNRVMVLHDGIRQEGQQWGDEHGVEIDDGSIDKVEVIKGPGSLMYGSDALAGVVNFISTPSLPEGQIKGNVTTQYQSNNNLIGYSAYIEGNTHNFNWLLRNSGKMAGNYSNRYDGKVFNSAFRELNADGFAGVTRKWGYSYLRFASFNQQPGLVEGTRNENGSFTKEVAVNDSVLEDVQVSNSDLNSYKLNIPRQQINHLRIQNDNKFYFNRQRISADFAFQQNVRKEFGDVLQKDEAQLYFQLRTFNFDLKYFLPDYHDWQTVIGAAGMLQQNSNKGDEVLIPEYTSSDLGAFITAEKKFGDLHASGGIRYDSRKINSKLFQQEGVVKFDTFNRTVQDFSASLGASYKLNSNSVLKLNLARGFRAPNIAELATNGVHEGTFRYEYGNRYLNPENSLQLDAGYSYNSSHLSFETSLFLSNINHYIFIEKLVSVQGNDSIPDVQNPIPAYKYTQGNAQLMGGEVNVDIHPHPLDWLHIENSFAVVYGSLLNVPDSMKYLPLIPAPKWQSELRAQFARKNKSLQNVYAKLEYVRVFRQDRIFAAYGTESATNGYGLVAVGIGCEVMNSRSNTVLLLHLSLNNVMNIAYQDHLSRLKYAPENQASGRIGVFNPGRNLTCKLIVPF